MLLNCTKKYDKMNEKEGQIKNGGNSHRFVNQKTLQWNQHFKRVHLFISIFYFLDLIQENEAPLPAPVENPVPTAEQTENTPLIEQKEDDAHSTVGASIINMTNNVLGSGLVALAYAVRNVVILFIG